MKIVKIGLVGLITVGGLVALYQSGYLQKEAPPARAATSDGENGRAALVRVKISEKSTFTDTVNAVGSTRARRTVDVVSMVEGKVDSINFAAGDRVEPGAVLVKLDDRTQQATLREARAALAEAHNSYERALSLAGQKFATQASVEQARSAFESAKAAVDRAAEDLADRTIKAPFGGIIGMARVEQGARIDTNTVLAPLDDLEEVEVEFRIPEIYLTRVTSGLRVTARSDAFGGREFEGTITAIDSRINPDSRAFAVRATISNPDLALRAGMFMNLSLELDSRESVAVPEEAIVTENSETYVYVVADDKAVRRQVKLGKRLDGTVEVVSGMSAGEQIISSGVQNVVNGRAIQIIGTEEKSAANRQRAG